jgi:hypothetical protein
VVSFELAIYPNAVERDEEVWPTRRYVAFMGLAVGKLNDIAKASNLPILRNNPHLGVLVARLYFHTNPIVFRCSSTRAARVSTSSARRGSGVA